MAGKGHTASGARLSLVILVHKARVQALGLETFLDLQSCWLLVQFVVFVLQRPLKIWVFWEPPRFSGRGGRWAKKSQ